VPAALLKLVARWPQGVLKCPLCGSNRWFCGRLQAIACFWAASAPFSGVRNVPPHYDRIILPANKERVGRHLVVESLLCTS